MEQIIQWMKKNKLRVIGVFLILFIIPVIVVHFLFSIESPWKWLEARWTAGELLNYIAGFEALLGSLLLGIVTVYQTEKANKLANKLAEENNQLQKISLQNSYPIVKIEDLVINNSVKSNVFSDTSTFQEKPGLYYFESVTPYERKKVVVIQGCDKENIKFVKQLNFKIRNISTSIISQIQWFKAETSGFKNRVINTSGAPISVNGVEGLNNTNVLILPDEYIDVELRFYVDNQERCNFWDESSEQYLGTFDLNLSMVNKTISDVSFCERIYIKKNGKTPEKILYDTFE